MTELNDRLLAVESQVTELMSWKTDKVEQLESMAESLTDLMFKMDKIDEIANAYEDGLTTASGFAQIAIEIKALKNDLLAHGLGITNVNGVSAQSQPPTQAPIYTPPTQTQAPAYSSNLPDLSGVQWNNGQWGDYAYSDKNPALASALAMAGGKLDYGLFTLSLSKDGKYINKRIKKTGGTPSSTPQSGGFNGSIKEPGSPATEKQIALIRRLGGFVTPGMTKQQASDLISNIKASKGQ